MIEISIYILAFCCSIFVDVSEKSWFLGGELSIATTCNDIDIESIAKIASKSSVDIWEN